MEAEQAASGVTREVWNADILVLRPSALPPDRALPWRLTGAVSTGGKCTARAAPFLVSGR